MRVSGFVMTDESGEVLAVSVGGSGDLVKSLAAPESKKELVAEHERLVDVLRSPDHKDDLAEADKQEAELTEYRGEAAGENLAKSHVKGYTRKDGTFVKEHEDRRRSEVEDTRDGHIRARNYHLAAESNERRKPVADAHRLAADLHGVAATEMKFGTHPDIAGLSEKARNSSKAAHEAELVYSFNQSKNPHSLPLDDLQKAHVKGYTRKDGTFVKEHDDSRQAAQPVSADRVNAIHDQHSDLMHRKETEWQHDAKKIPAPAVSGLPEFSHKEVYGHNRDVSPVGGDFSPEFAKQGHQGFVLRHKDGKRSFVDTQGSDYARYHAPVEDAPAGVNSDDAFEKIKAAGGTDVTTTSGHINYTHNGQQKQLAHKDAADGHRYVDSGELEQHLSDMKGGSDKSASSDDWESNVKATHPGAVIKKDAKNGYLNAFVGTDFVGRFTFAQGGKPSSSQISPAKPAAGGYDHPNAVGKGEFGTDGPAKDWSMKFAGTDYTHTGKEGKSAHDDTPVREFESEDGHRVWADGAGRVHADSKDEVAGLRQKYEASVAPKAEKKAAPKKAASGGSDSGVPGKPMAKSLLFVQIGGADELLSMAKSVIGPGSGD